LYFGFVLTGEVEDGEIVVQMKLTLICHFGRIQSLK